MKTKKGEQYEKKEKREERDIKRYKSRDLKNTMREAKTKYIKKGRK